MEQLRLLSPSKLLVAFELRHDAIVEGNVGGATAQFTHHERCGRLLLHIESLAVAVGSEEDMIIDVRVNSLAEDRLQADHRFPLRKARGAGIFKPAVRAFDGGETDLAGANVHCHAERAVATKRAAGSRGAYR